MRVVYSLAVCSLAVALMQGCAFSRGTLGDDIQAEAVGSIKKGQGLVVHAAECRHAQRSRRVEPEQWIDVEWDRRPSRLFQAAIRVTVANQRGVLAKVASEIAEAAFEHLDAPPVRVASADTPIPFAKRLESEVYSAAGRLTAAVDRLLAY